MYQRKINLYKGIDNTIEFDVRQSDDRRLSVIDQEAVVKFYDAIRQNLFSVTATPVLSKTGIMALTIPADVLDNIEPQQLTLAAYLIDGNNNKTILYADTQFGVATTVEVLNGYNDAPRIVDVIKTWNYDMGSKDLVSEIVDFKQLINSDVSTAPVSSSEMIVTPNADNPFQGTITVEATDDKSLAIGNRWVEIGTINANEYDSKTFTGDWRFIRFRYPKWVDSQTQLQSTGIVDKIIVTN